MTPDKGARPPAEVEFITVASVDEVPPGERLALGLGRDWIVLFNIEGAFYAIEDRCSHDDVPLSEGRLIGTSVSCIKHGALFDVTTGDVLSPPAVRGVKTYPVRVVGDEVQIGRKKR
jgi:nitrite reductase/ring-hydroxylating ferredoxin subunit